MRRNILLGIGLLFSAFLLAGCGGSTESVEQYDTMINELGFHERDIARLSAPNTRKQIDSDSISNFVVGTVINVIDSTYNNTPIFNLKLIDDESLLDLNAQSASQDDIAIIMTSNKNATSFSYAVSADSKTSANFGGLFSLGAAIHADHSMALANSDGSIYVSMNRGKHGSYYEFNTSDLASGFDLTPYLIGTPLSESEIKQYVDYTEESAGVSKGTYIHELIFQKNQGHGQVDWSQRNVYGNVQLLSEMEEIFGILRAQYDTFADNETVRNIVYTNMMTLKQKIGHAVQDFYSHVGTHFVSKLYFANYAYGYGTLQFDENSGNEEARVGVALSLGGGVPSKFSAESASSATFAQQSGWAGAMKNLHIEAHSRPGGMDLGSFASQIKSILSDEGTPLYVPTLKVPTSPTVEVLDTPALKKEVSAPPDSVFASYKEWKQYQKDLKAGSEVDTEIKDISDELDVEGLDSLLDEDPTEPDNNGTTLYHRFSEELELLLQESDRDDGDIVEQGSNILRIDDMIVSGFETTPYEDVISALRTSKIVLPDRADRADSYANATKLLMVVDLFRQLADYTQFMSNFVISNVSKSFNAQIQDFYEAFSDKAYDLATTHMTSGQDIEVDLLHHFAVDMYGDAENGDVENSQLYKSLGSDRDKFNYVKYLCNPKVMHVWRDAPGGYAPFVFKNQNLVFAALDQLADMVNYDGYTQDVHCNQHLYKIVSNRGMRIKDTPNPVDLYDGRSESPLFPIFRYELKHDPKLLFLQLAGRFQLIFGSNGMIAPYYRTPYYPDLRVDPIDLRNSAIAFQVKEQNIKETIYTNMAADIHPTTFDLLMEYCEGFDVDSLDRTHALYFPDKTQTKDLWEANRIMRVSVSSDKTTTCVTSDQFRPTLPDGRDSFYYKGYAFTDIYSALVDQYDTGKTIGQIVKVKDGSTQAVKAGFFLLFPIDYSKVNGGYGSLLMGASYGVDNYVGNPTYDAALITSTHD